MKCETCRWFGDGNPHGIPPMDGACHYQPPFPRVRRKDWCSHHAPMTATEAWFDPKYTTEKPVTMNLIVQTCSRCQHWRDKTVCGNRHICDKTGLWTLRTFYCGYWNSPIDWEHNAKTQKMKCATEAPINIHRWWANQRNKIGQEIWL